MNEVKTMKQTSKPLVDYSLIILGSFTIAVGYVFFIIPYQIIPGGVYGLSIIINALTGLPVGMTALCFNIPLVILAYKVLGSGSLPKTITTFIITAVFVDLLSLLPKTDVFAVLEEPLLASIYGGAILGLSVYLIFRAKSTCAGTDVLAKVMSKFTNISVGTCITIVDSIIVIIGLIAFNFDWKVPLYSCISIFVYGKVVNALQEGLRNDRAVFIFTSKSTEIGHMIINTMKGGGTYFHGKGIYQGEEREIVYTVIDSSKVQKLKDNVHLIDPTAFLTFLPANDIYGRGFKDLADKF